MNARYEVLAVAIACSVGLLGCQSTEEPKAAEPAPVAASVPEKPLSVQESIEATMTAQVRALNHATRVITLQDKTGHAVTFTVADDVRRLNEVMVGDEVKTQYTATLLAELRPPTAAEAASPISVVEVAARSPQGTAPAAGVVQATRIVTTVEAVDVPNMRVTLRGPMGDLVVVRGKNPDNLRRLKVGDTIVLTFTESVVVGLEQVGLR